MKKSRILTWVTVLLYMVSVLGMTAWAEDGDGALGDGAPAAQNEGESVPAGEPQTQSPPADTGSGDQPGPSDSGGDSSAPEAGSTDSGGGSSGPEAGPTDSGGGSSAPEADPTGSGGGSSGPEAGPAGSGGGSSEPERNPFKPEDEDFLSEPEDFDPEEEPSEEEELPESYRVWFITPDGHILLDYEAEAGTPVAEPNFTPGADKGFVFAFWYEVGGGVTPFAFGAPLEGDLVLAAYFKPVPVEEEPEEEELEEEEEMALPTLKVDISSDAGEMVFAGDRITLFAHVSEWTEGHDCSSLWRYNDGSGWVVAATDTQTYSFAVDGENYYWSWEFVFTVHIGVVEGEEAA